eukprot:1101852-Lingulodinium_polyedra.AAC.1
MFCLGASRLRDPSLLDFADCNIDAEAQTITLETVDSEFHFVTGYTIAKELLMAADSRFEIEMTIVNDRSDPNTPFTVNIVDR